MKDIIDEYLSNNEYSELSNFIIAILKSDDIDVINSLKKLIPYIIENDHNHNPSWIKYVLKASSVNIKSILFENLSKFNYYDMDTEMITEMLSTIFTNSKTNTKLLKAYYDEVSYFVVNNLNRNPRFINMYVDLPNYIEIINIIIKEYKLIRFDDNRLSYIRTILKKLIKDNNVDMINKVIELYRNIDYKNTIEYNIETKKIYHDFYNQPFFNEIMSSILSNPCLVSTMSKDILELNDIQLFSNYYDLIIDSNVDLFEIKYFLEQYGHYDIIDQINNYIIDNPKTTIKKLLIDTLSFYGNNNPSKIDVDNDLLFIVNGLFEEISKNEQVNIEDITFLGNGSTSKVYAIGDKVFKLGTNRYSNVNKFNPYIVQPLLLKKIQSNNIELVLEVSQRALPDILINDDDLYDLYKKMRDLGLVWMDIRADNVGRLLRDNKLYWNEDLNVNNQDNSILKTGELVVIDNDFIFNEDDYENIENIDIEFSTRYREFEERYLMEHRIR